MFFAPAWSRRRKAAHGSKLRRPCAHTVSNQNPASEGVQPKRGSVLGTRQAASRKLPPRADSPLAEQARNRDHDSSDPSSQAKKQQKIAQKHRHIAPPLCLR